MNGTGRCMMESERNWAGYLAQPISSFINKPADKEIDHFDGKSDLNLGKSIQG